ATGSLSTLVAVGQKGLKGPHGLAYDAQGSLWIADPAGKLLRVSAATGEIETVAPVGVFKVLPLADGGALVVSGNPSGGRVRHLAADGTLTAVAGTGRLSGHKDGIQARRGGSLPSEVAVFGGGSLVAETEPLPSIRRIDSSGRISTLVR